MAVASESYAPSVLVSTEGLPEKDWLEYRRRQKLRKTERKAAKYRCSYTRVVPHQRGQRRV